MKESAAGSDGRKDEKSAHEDLVELFKACPIPEAERVNNLGVFMKRQALTRLIFMYELYRKIIPVHGIIAEFGVRWGQNMSLFSNFRGMLEPFNYNRRIVGFDTFSGFPSVSDNDPGHARKGGMNVTENYQDFLEKILACHENFNPIPNIRKHQLVKGDATKTFKKYLEDHPETIIAFAYFDFDIYEPTKVCLELLKDRLTKGSVIGFDEINNPNWPGETVALKEVLGLDRYRIQRLPYMPTSSFIVIE
ncbi:MAG TPA: TylF/MycF/NovP-related O-methyltransferase [Fibrobacteria bacterium]|nr:TylF/MycF/NovP-related O-methyltransferase [Fibrobacteria bacterium]